jgi:hypothetical protein
MTHKQGLSSHQRGCIKQAELIHVHEPQMELDTYSLTHHQLQHNFDFELTVSEPTLLGAIT